MLVLLKVFWDLVAKQQIMVYLDKVSPGSNPYDGMSRNGEEEAREMGWRVEEAFLHGTDN